ncbi:MAG: hypothetical protein IPK68_14370 [Bdellovibrionales bacterium]|nr:hypothetical protein [Bdellovibrionales bacterium]
MANDSESFEKKDLEKEVNVILKASGISRCTLGFADGAIDNKSAGPQAFGDFVVSKRHRELAEAISGVQDRVRLGAVLTR